jgi:hypothetical protein
MVKEYVHLFSYLLQRSKDLMIMTFARNKRPKPSSAQPARMVYTAVL